MTMRNPLKTLFRALNRVETDLTLMFNGNRPEEISTHYFLRQEDRFEEKVVTYKSVRGSDSADVRSKVNNPILHYYYAVARRFDSKGEESLYRVYEYCDRKEDGVLRRQVSGALMREGDEYMSPKTRDEVLEILRRIEMTQEEQGLCRMESGPPDSILNAVLEMRLKRIGAEKNAHPALQAL